MMKDSTIRKPENMSAAEFNAASERGRAMAASVIATDMQARLLVENTFGIEYCKARYPEAYQSLGVA